jgi:hypothetical protein
MAAFPGEAIPITMPSGWMATTESPQTLAKAEARADDAQFLANLPRSAATNKHP